MPNFLQYFNLPAYSFDVLLVFNSGLLKNLDGNFLIGECVDGQFDFAERAFAKCLSEDVVAQSRAFGMRIMRVRIVLSIPGLRCAVPLIPGIVIGLVAS